MGFGQFAAFGGDPFVCSYNPFAPDPRQWGSAGGAATTPNNSMTSFTFPPTFGNPRHSGIGTAGNSINQAAFGFGMETQPGNLGLQSGHSLAPNSPTSVTFPVLNQQAQSFANAMMCANNANVTANGNIIDGPGSGIPQLGSSIPSPIPVGASNDPSGLMALRRKALEQTASMNSFSALSNCGFDLR